MNSTLIIQLVALSAPAAYPMAWVQAKVQGRVAIWTNGRLAAKTPNAQTTASQTPAMVNIHHSARFFFIRAVILIIMLVLFRYLLSE